MKLILLFLFLLTGCASPAFFENRVACAIGGDEAHVVSKWGSFSIGAKLALADTAVLCQKPLK